MGKKGGGGRAGIKTPWLVLFCFLKNKLRNKKFLSGNISVERYRNILQVYPAILGVTAYFPIDN